MKEQNKNIINIIEYLKQSLLVTDVRCLALGLAYDHKHKEGLGM